MKYNLRKKLELWTDAELEAYRADVRAFHQTREYLDAPDADEGPEFPHGEFPFDPRPLHPRQERKAAAPVAADDDIIEF